MTLYVFQLQLALSSLWDKFWFIVHPILHATGLDGHVI